MKKKHIIDLFHSISCRNKQLTTPGVVVSRPRARPLDLARARPVMFHGVPKTATKRTRWFQLVHNPLKTTTSDTTDVQLILIFFYYFFCLTLPTFLLFYCMPMFLCEEHRVCLVYEKYHINKVSLSNVEQSLKSNQ